MKSSEIYHVGYRQLPEGALGGSPILPIAQSFIRVRWGFRSTKLVMLLGGSVFLMHAGWLLVLLLGRKAAVDVRMSPGGIGPEQVLGSTQEVLARFLSIQFYVTALATAAIGSSAIADDRAAGSWTVYFSRPVSRFQYALGKFIGVSVVPLALYVVPTLVLWSFAIGVTEVAERAQLWALGPASLGIACLGTLFLGSTLLAMSAAGLKSRSVAVVYVMALFLLAGLSEASNLGGRDFLGYFGPERCLRTCVVYLFQPGESMLAQSFGRLTINPSALASCAALLVGSIAATLNVLRVLSKDIHQ